MIRDTLAFETSFMQQVNMVLIQQNLAPVGAGEEDGQRLLLLPRRYNWILRRQPDIREGPYDPYNGARGFHQRKIL